jgi:hypothetical protein
MVKSTTKLIVSDRVRLLAERENWTNVWFDGLGIHRNANQPNTEQIAPPNP